MITDLSLTVHTEAPLGAKRPHRWRAEIYLGSYLVTSAWADDANEAMRAAHARLAEALLRLVETSS